MDQDKLDLINALASFLDMRAEVAAALCGDGAEQWRDCCMFAEAAIDGATPDAGALTHADKSPPRVLPPIPPAS